MTVSKGQQYIDSLKDNRNVWLHNNRIDVTAHEAFHGTLQTIRELFDMLDDPVLRAKISFQAAPSGNYVHASFLVPRNPVDLLKRSEAFAIWAEHTNGVMSRLSDYARSRLTGWYATRELYRSFDPHFPAKISRYYEEACTHNLFLTAVQREPQIDRSKPWNDGNEDAVLRIISKNSEGVVIRGAKMIATAAPYANDFIVYPVQKIPADSPECASMLIVQANSPGLHILCRESYASDLTEEHPISSRYDEMDAVLFFDDVLVPWERVLLHDNPDALWQIRTNDASNSLAYHQTIVRLLIKLEFITGVAFQIAEAIGVHVYLNVQELLGELVSQVETVRGLIIAAESQAKPDDWDNWLPAYKYIETARNLGTRFYPRAVDILKQIGAGGYIQVPASLQDMSGPLSYLTEKYMQGAGIQAKDRTKLFKMAWDLIGSPLGSRHELYERFYAGDPVRLSASQYMNYGDKDRLKEKVMHFLMKS